MRHLKQHPISEAFWNRKKPEGIDRLYIKSNGVEVLNTLNIPDSSKYYLIEVYSPTINKVKNYFIPSNDERETIIKNDYYQRSYYNLDSHKDKNYRWINFNNERDKLLKISKELGFNIGKRVLTEDGETEITSIDLLVFWNSDIDFINWSINAICTLRYRCGNGYCYQVCQLLPSQIKEEEDEVEDQIKDNIVDIQDLGLDVKFWKGQERIEVSPGSFSRPSFFVYKIFINKRGRFSVDDMHVISTSVKTMRDRLENFEVIISDLKSNSNGQDILIIVYKNPSNL